MTRILLVGTELPLLEGLAQSLGALGFSPMVATTLHEGRELATHDMPLVAVVSRKLAAESSGEMLSIPLSPGGALVLYSSAADHSHVAVAERAAIGSCGPDAADWSAIDCSRWCSMSAIGLGRPGVAGLEITGLHAEG
jgi:hypothetical protein